MRVKPNPWTPWLFASFSLCFALPAAADITVMTRFTLANGDTLTRPTYYSSRRVRLTGVDGKEFMYDSKAGRLTILDHSKKIYWTGPLAQADSIADRMLNAGRKQLAAAAAEDQEAWMAKVQSFNDSIRVTKTENTRKIAGYPTTQWLFSVGSYIQHERWVARSLQVTNYGPELEKAIMASLRDPVGRALMRMLIGLREGDGLPLASKTTFQTFTQSGSFGFEAVRVIGESIPASAWEVPKDYVRIEL
jgi:hypothetical protein